jgi:hypothetical protein
MTLTLTGENVFLSLLGGADAFSPSEFAALQGYLRELSVARGFPLHPVVCWNALCWDYDVESRRYGDAPLDNLLDVRHGVVGDALPVGAFVRVAAGLGRGEFWGEVIYKEGRGVPVDSRWVSPASSGAPAVIVDDGRQRSVLREALIVDFAAIEEPDGQSLERQRQRGEFIDERHHLIVDALYDAHDADLDDATYFARWMITHLRDPLIQGRFGAALSDEVVADDDLLFSALVASISVLREVMASVPGCAMWRDYLFDLTEYENRMTPEAEEPPLGPSDMARMANMLTRPPAHSSVGYSSLGALVLELGGGGADLYGPAWVAAVCHASYYLIKWLEENAPDGWCDSRDGAVHVRLDDAWLVGGVWRVERLTDGLGAYCAIPPEVPLGLGYAESTGMFEVPEEFETPLTVNSTQIAMSISLTVADVMQSRLRLDRAALGVIAAERGDTIVVRLNVEGLALLPSEVAHSTTVHCASDEVASLWGVVWPYPYCAGSRVNVVWVRGSSAVDVVLRRREEPFVIGEYVYEYECDERLFARGNGVPEPPSARGRSLRDLVLDVIRWRGDDSGDGCRQATFARVLYGVYGPGAPPSAAASIRVVLDGLVHSGSLTADGDLFVWCPGSGRAAHVGDAGLSDYEGDVPRYVRLHGVRIFLRRLRISERVSPEREREYHEEWLREGRPLGMPPELPRRYTFVRPHERGTRNEYSSTTEEEK